MSAALQVEFGIRTTSVRSRQAEIIAFGRASSTWTLPSTTTIQTTTTGTATALLGLDDLDALSWAGRECSRATADVVGIGGTTTGGEGEETREA